MGETLDDHASEIEDVMMDNEMDDGVRVKCDFWLLELLQSKFLPMAHLWILDLYPQGSHSASLSELMV